MDYNMIESFRQSLNIFRLNEELFLQRRDLHSRIDRKLREKLSPPIRDLMPSRRERQQRNRRHRLKNIDFGPRKILSTKFRYR